MFFLTLILWVVVFAISEFLKPKPAITNAKPAGLGEFNFPTATEGRSVPLIWGTARLDAPNVVWYGNLRAVPVTKKVKTGLFSSKKQTTGYNYYIGIQFALCRGEIDQLIAVTVGTKAVWRGSMHSGPITINKPNAFGGDDQGGGLIGQLQIFPGSTTQSVDSYLASKITADMPAFRGTSHAVWRGGYIGNSTQIQPWAFEITRIPNGLALTGGDDIIKLFDANPMNVIYEILTDPDWGLGFVAGDIDLVGFTAAAHTLAVEGNGFSMILDNPSSAGDLISQIEQQIDGVLYLDRLSGKFQIKLIRDDYDITTVPQLDESNIIKVENFTRGSWFQTTNNVRIKFTNRQKNYRETYALAQDAANISIQGTVVTSDQQYPGVFNGSNASALALRMLRVAGFPLAKAQFTVDRTMHFLNPGDVVKWVDSSLGIVGIPMRVTRIDLGALDDGSIKLDVVQDVFEFQEGVMGDPPDSAWVDPEDTVTPTDIVTADRTIFESPRAFCDQATENPGTIDRIWVGARYPSDQSSSFQIWTNEATAGYLSAGETFGYLLAAKVQATIGTGVAQGTSDITVTCDPDSQDDIIAQITTQTAASVGRDLQNVVKIGDEFIGYLSATILSTDKIVLHNCYRGLMDTIQEAHAINDLVWFVSFAGSLTENTYGPTASVDTKLLSSGTYGVLDISLSSVTTIVMNNRAHRPYPIAAIKLNADVAAWGGTASLDYQSGATLDTIGLQINFLRRDFRTADEVESVLNEDGAASGFPASNTTQYRVSLYNDPAGANTLVKQSDWFDGNAYTISRARLFRETVTIGGTSDQINVFTYANGRLEVATSGYWTVNAVVPYPIGSSVTVGDGISVITSNIAQVDNTLVSGSTTRSKNAVRLFGSPLPFPVAYECKAYVKQGGLIHATVNPVISYWFNMDGNPSSLTNPYIELIFPSTGTPQAKVRITDYTATQHTTNVTVVIDTEYLLTAEILADLSVKVYINGVLVATQAGFMNPTYTLFYGFAIGLASPTASGVVKSRGQFRAIQFNSFVASVYPANMKATVEARHTFGTSVFEATKVPGWSFAVTTTDLLTTPSLGVLPVTTVSSVFTSSSTGTFTLNTGTAITVQYRLNGGGWVTLFTLGTTGTFAVNSGDTIEVQHTVAGTNALETFFELRDGTLTRVAYGIFTY